MAKNTKPEIEILRKRFDELRDRRTTAQANLKIAEENLKKLQEQAREKYQTDDPAELKRILENMREENRKKQEEYKKHLEEIEQQLDNLESEGAVS